MSMTTKADNGSLLEVRDLTIKFGGLTAVDGADFEVRQGELLGIIGPNGAGKTTLFNAIVGVVKPTHGQILFKQQRIDGKQPDQIARMGIGRTFQTVRLFNSMTVLENISVASSTVEESLGLAEKRADEIIRLIGLQHRAHQKVNTVPLADRKRTEIARALATKPDILLLDEMMSGLNITETTEILSLIRRLNVEGLTMIVIEHVLRVMMELSHRIIVLDHGALIAEGEPTEVMENPLVIEAYIGRKHSADR
jgi:branched-chain amino acid transport system ATP-binding protein